MRKLGLLGSRGGWVALCLWVLSVSVFAATETDQGDSNFCGPTLEAAPISRRSWDHPDNLVFQNPLDPTSKGESIFRISAIQFADGTKVVGTTFSVLGGGHELIEKVTVLRFPDKEIESRFYGEMRSQDGIPQGANRTSGYAFEKDLTCTPKLLEDWVVAHFAGRMPPDFSIESYNPKKKHLDERVNGFFNPENPKDTFAHALRGILNKAKLSSEWIGQLLLQTPEGYFKEIQTALAMGRWDELILYLKILRENGVADSLDDEAASAVASLGEGEMDFNDAAQHFAALTVAHQFGESVFSLNKKTLRDPATYQRMVHLHVEQKSDQQ